MNKDSIIRDRQAPLATLYHKEPSAAMITDVALIEGENLDDPFHTTVTINDELNVPFRVGVHRAVGGLHDHPNPGDLLCASLASCFETTLRLIADRLQIQLIKTRVRATADVDVRGTLMLDRETPVNFQEMTLEVLLNIGDAPPSMGKKLIKGAEHCCIIYQTLKKAIPVQVRVSFT